MQRRGAARGSSLLLALALLAMGVAVEGKRHRGAHNSNNHYTVDAPSTAGVVGAAMGHTALMSELEDETSRLQSALGGFIWVWVYGWVGLDQFVDRWIGSFICTYTRKLLKLPTNPHQPPKTTVQIPRDLFRPEGYSHKEALFGIPVYGGTIAERLYYANTTRMCSAPTAEEVAKWKSPYILMVDRGDCTFVTKVGGLVVVCGVYNYDGPTDPSTNPTK